MNQLTNQINCRHRRGFIKEVSACLGCGTALELYICKKCGKIAKESTIQGYHKDCDYSGYFKFNNRDTGL